MALLVLPWLSTGSSCSCSAELFMGPPSTHKEMQAHDLGNFVLKCSLLGSTALSAFVVPNVQAAKFDQKVQ